jgi:O-antigen/teichoic acid export membrane protein
MPQKKGTHDRQHTRLIRAWLFVFLGFGSLLLSFVPAASGRPLLVWPPVVIGVLFCVFGVITIARKSPNDTLPTQPEYETETPQNS